MNTADGNVAEGCHWIRVSTAENRVKEKMNCRKTHGNPYFLEIFRAFQKGILCFLRKKPAQRAEILVLKLECLDLRRPAWFCPCPAGQ
jgi:hypothetical protein